MEKELKDLKKFKIITIICIVLSVIMMSISTALMIIFADNGYICGAVLMFAVLIIDVLGYFYNFKTLESIVDQEENIKNRQKNLQKLKEFEEKLKKDSEELIKMLQNFNNSVNYEQNIYSNLQFREEIIKNCYGKLTNKDLKNDFMKEIVATEHFDNNSSKDVTVKDAIEKFKEYKFILRTPYEKILSRYEEKQAVLDKYIKGEQNGSKTSEKSPKNDK